MKPKKIEYTISKDEAFADYSEGDKVRAVLLVESLEADDFLTYFPLNKKAHMSDCAALGISTQTGSKKFVKSKNDYINLSESEERRLRKIFGIK